MIKSGVSTACLYPRVVEDCLYQLAIRGVDHVEIFFNTHSELEFDFIKNLKKIIDEYKMTVSSIHPYTCAIEPTMFFTQYPRRFLDILDYYKKYFEIMNILGAKIFVFHGNKVQNVFPNDEYFERYLKLYKVGQEFGITVAQENVSRCTSGDLSFLKEMSNALGNCAKFVFDTKQAIRREYNPFDFLDVLQEKIIHIHLSDHGKNGDCLLIGEGDMNFNEFVAKLKKYSFTGSIILELYSNGYKKIDDLSDNLSYFRNIIEKHC